jgi:HK97 family phage major capsid protein
VEITHAQAVNRLKDIADEIERLAAKEDITDEDETYRSELVTESEAVYRHKVALEREADRQKVLAFANGKTETDRAGNPTKIVIERTDEDDTDRAVPQRSSKRFKNPWDLSEVRSTNPAEFRSEMRARALDAIEIMPGTDDKRREVMTNLIERWEHEAEPRISTLALRSSDETYLRAYGKLLKHEGRMEFLNSDEQSSVARAMSLTSNAGGYLVPFQLDPTVIITANGSFNQVRGASRQVVATGNTWNGVTSGGSTGSWDNEAVEVSDDASTFGGPAITICKLQIFTPISAEAMEDEVNVAQAVADISAFEADRLESVAFVTGTGTNQPQGIITALSGGSSSVNTTTADTFGLVDLYALDGALPARFRFRASWLAHRKIYNATRQFDTSGGAALWVQLANDVPSNLLGKPALEAEAMDSTASGTNKLFLVFGDFNNYVVADRIGATMEFIPNLFSTGNGRPTGQRGWLMRKRVGADSVNDGAFRMLNGQ